MEVQAPLGPTQVLTEKQAVELVKQRRAAAQEAKQVEPVVKPEETPAANADEPSADEQVDGEAQPVSEGEPAEEVSVDPDEEPVIKYVVDGKPQTASIKEAKEALASVKHLSRLRNEIVENHKSAQATAQEVQAQRQQMLERLQEVEHLLASGLPQPQYMQQLLEAGDTAGYLKAQQAHQRFAQVRAFKEQQAAQAKEAEAKARAMREQVEAEELLKANPDFAKPEYVNKLVRFLTEEEGLTEEEVASLGARELKIADKARKWDEWNRNKTLGIKKAVATAAQPSAAPKANPVDAKQYNALREKVRNGGNMADQIALMKLKRQMKG